MDELVLRARLLVVAINFSLDIAGDVAYFFHSTIKVFCATNNSSLFLEVTICQLSHYHYHILLH